MPTSIKPGKLYLIALSIAVTSLEWAMPASSAFCEPNWEAYAQAIYQAEGGSKTRFPYGIVSINTHGDKELAHRICLNTIRHKHRDWVSGGRKGRFLDYLASRYAPVGAENDPTGLNKNWIRNVEYYLERQA